MGGREMMRVRIINEVVSSFNYKYISGTACMMHDAVRLLQASDNLRLPVFEPDSVDKPEQRRSGRRLLCVEQRPQSTVLQLRFVQGRSAGKPQKGMEESQPHHHHHRRDSHLGLSHRLQCIQECPDRRTFPQVQAGLGMIDLAGTFP